MRVLSFTVRSEVAERLKAEAAAAGVSINQLLRNILEVRDWATRNGPFPAEPARKRKGFLEEFFG